MGWNIVQNKKFDKDSWLTFIFCLWLLCREKKNLKIWIYYLLIFITWSMSWDPIRCVFPFSSSSDLLYQIFVQKCYYLFSQTVVLRVPPRGWCSSMNALSWCWLYACHVAVKSCVAVCFLLSWMVHWNLLW